MSMQVRLSKHASKFDGGRWMKVAWFGLVPVAIYACVFFAFNVALPKPTDPNAFSQNPVVRANLAVDGLTPEMYDGIQAIFKIAMSLSCCLVGAVLIWRRPIDRMALFVAFLLTAYPIVAVENTAFTSFPILVALPAWLIRWSWFAAVASFFFLFPNGRWVPRWTRWLALLWVLGQVYAALTLNPQLRSTTWIRALNLPLFVGWAANLICFLLAPVYRYLRRSSPGERQQIKWLMVGVGGVFVPGIIYSLVNIAFPSFAPVGSLLYVVGQALIQCLQLFIPISIGIAILKYRLYDVNVIINRTLVYGSLTATLALIYVASIALLQTLLRPFVNSSSQFVTVASTLLLAALFQPLRRRIQALIDRRFYRRKYDAQKTLQAFSARLRDEVDLNQLNADLVAVVQETLQPARVSLWLRESPGVERLRRKDGE